MLYLCFCIQKKRAEAPFLFCIYFKREVDIGYGGVGFSISDVTNMKIVSALLRTENK